MASYLKAPDGEGEKRRAEITALANEQLDIERRAADMRKAQKAHIEAVTSATTLDI
jgi:hypothetical protein